MQSTENLYALVLLKSCTFHAQSHHAALKSCHFSRAAEERQSVFKDYDRGNIVILIILGDKIFLRGQVTVSRHTNL